MSKKKRTVAELQAELRLVRRWNRASGWSGIVMALIKWAGIVAVFAFLYMTVDSLAGKQTKADIAVDFLKVASDRALAWGVAGGSVLYGLGQRKLRRDTIEKLTKQNAELETRLDPGRSSSRLSPRGETREEDR